MEIVDLSKNLPPGWHWMRPSIRNGDMLYGCSRPIPGEKFKDVLLHRDPVKLLEAAWDEHVRKYDAED